MKWRMSRGTMRSCIWRASILVVVAALAPKGARAYDASPEVGTAVTIKREVVATLGEDKRDLHEGGRVRRTEYLQTGEGAQAELKLDDKTKLAIGPNAGLKLDDFVIGKADGASISVNFVKGTFRFITGSESKDAYKIVTPSASMGVRGTVFDVYVDDSGDTLVLLHEGEVEIYTKQNTCRRHNSAGRIVHATVAGVISAPLKFTNGLIPGLSVGGAFPFVGKALRIDPIRRLSSAKLLDGSAGKAGRAITGGGRSVGRKLRKALPF